MRPRFPISVLTVIILLLLIFITAEINDWQWNFIKNPMFWGIMIIVTIMMVIYGEVSKLVDSEKFKTLTEEEKEKYLAESKKPFFTRLYDSAFGKQDEVDEKDLMMDHSYDGITELDNKLPQWWLALFYFGVVFLVLYMLLFATTDFAHPKNELAQSDEKYYLAVADYDKTVPQKSPEEMVYSESNVEEGKKLFKVHCASCHQDDGGAMGNAGANLTDDYWRNIYKDDLYQNIVNVIWNGSQYDKSMVAFGKNGQIRGNDVEKIASFVNYINQSIPNANPGKAPLGEIVKEWAQDPIPAGAPVVSAKDIAGGEEEKPAEGEEQTPAAAENNANVDEQAPADSAATQ